jgi:lysophospholipase L1-like esterase
MRRAALVFVALLAACSASQPKLARLAPDAVVLAFGDSLTAGVGASAAESYPARLEALIGRKVVSSGVPGETSAAGLARLPAALDEASPQLVILCEGGNDFLQKLDEAQAAENLRAMVRLAKARGAQVVLIAVPKPGLLPSSRRSSAFRTRKPRSGRSSPTTSSSLTSFIRTQRATPGSRRRSLRCSGNRARCEVCLTAL